MGVLSYQFYGGYAQTDIFYFSIPQTTANGTDAFYSGAGGPFVANDAKISKDGAAFTNTANLVTQSQAAGKEYSLTLTTAEMSANNIVVLVSDADGPAWGDVSIAIRTNLNLGNVAIQGGNGPQAGSGAVYIASNLSAVSPNATPPVDIAVASASTVSPVQFNIVSPSAVPAIGFTSGIGDMFGVLRTSTAQAGAATTITLDAGASATDSFYNECSIAITGGTGVGQSRTIVSYVGATKVATLNRTWSTNPGASSTFTITRGGDVWDQLEGAQPAVGGIANNTTFRVIWQWIKRRFLNRVTQTATTQTMYQDDSATVLSTMACSSDGTTQVKGKSS